MKKSNVKIKDGISIKEWGKKGSGYYPFFREWQQLPPIQAVLLGYMLDMGLHKGHFTLAGATANLYPCRRTLLTALKKLLICGYVSVVIQRQKKQDLYISTATYTITPAVKVKKAMTFKEATDTIKKIASLGNDIYIQESKRQAV